MWLVDSCVVRVVVLLIVLCNFYSFVILICLFWDAVCFYLKRFVLLGLFCAGFRCVLFYVSTLIWVSRFDCCFSTGLGFRLLWLIYVCLDWLSCCSLLRGVGGWFDLCSVDCGALCLCGCRCWFCWVLVCVVRAAFLH